MYLTFVFNFICVFFFCIRIVNDGVGLLRLGSMVVLGGGGTCLGEVGVFVFVQVSWVVQETKSEVQEAYALTMVARVGSYH